MYDSLYGKKAEIAHSSKLPFGATTIQFDVIVIETDQAPFATPPPLDLPEI